MSKTLIDKAIEIGRKNSPGSSTTKEEIDLAVSWAKGDVGLNQVMKVMEFKSPSKTYTFLAFALGRYISDKKR